MTNSDLAPKFKAPGFNCPHCSAHAEMMWDQLSVQQNASPQTIHKALCWVCKRYSLWITSDGQPPVNKEGTMVFPTRRLLGPEPHQDMPEAARANYTEARQIGEESPRGACALLRLSVQRLCDDLVEGKQNLNEKIGVLVTRGLPSDLQQSLDIVRVIGNNAVHPGQMDDDDISEVAIRLFELVNFIVEDRIARPVQLKHLYAALPEGARKGIEKRDGSEE